MTLQNLKATLSLRAFGLTQIPMILFLSPRVVHVDDRRIEVCIPLTYRSRNHLKSMYFGALAVGADCASGLLAMRLIDPRKDKQISLVFKDFSAQFLKRPEGDVHFSCEMGPEIRALVEQAATTGQRCHLPLKVTATVPKVSGQDPVATFVLTLSLKAKT
jgi:acyl-coenzyme A thioesterase PaaI-like protein